MRAVRGDLNRASRPTVQLEGATGTDWREDAACRSAPIARGSDPFYPEPGTTGAEAKRWCSLCPVLDQCRTAIMKAERGKSAANRFGILAGMSPDERWTLAHRTDRKTVTTAECGTPGGYNRHRYVGETACDACRAAVAQVARDRRARRKAGQA